MKDCFKILLKWHKQNYPPCFISLKERKGILEINSELNINLFFLSKKLMKSELVSGFYIKRNHIYALILKTPLNIIPNGVQKLSKLKILNLSVDYHKKDFILIRTNNSDTNSQQVFDLSLPNWIETLSDLKSFTIKGYKVNFFPNIKVISFPKLVELDLDIYSVNNQNLIDLFLKINLPLNTGVREDINKLNQEMRSYFVKLYILIRQWPKIQKLQNSFDLTPFKDMDYLLQFYSDNNYNFEISILKDKIIGIDLARSYYINNDIFSVILENKELIYLRISDLRINSIPIQIKSLDKLEYLILNNNNLQDLPQEMSELKSLKYLNIEDNPFSCFFWKKIFNNLPEKNLIFSNSSQIQSILSKIENWKGHFIQSMNEKIQNGEKLDQYEELWPDYIYFRNEIEQVLNIAAKTMPENETVQFFLTKLNPSIPISTQFKIIL